LARLMEGHGPATEPWTREAIEDKARREGPALFSLRLGNSIHLARKRLSRFLIFCDETREYPTVHQGDDLELFILEVCNHFYFQFRALDRPIAKA